MPDYLAFGPVFPTRSKLNPEPVTGPEVLARAHVMCTRASVPLVGIGGIVESSLAMVAERCNLVAAISLLLPPRGQSRPYDFIERRSSELHARLTADR